MSTPGDKARGGTVQGEGDYEAGRRFDKAEGEFVKSGSYSCLPPAPLVR